MKRLAFITLVILFNAIGFHAMAQSQKEPYLTKIATLCPDADIVSIEAKEDYVEVDYLCDGKLFEVGLNHHNEIMFLETEADIPENILEKIHKKLNKKFYGWVIDEYSYIKTYDTAFYKVEIINSGVENNIYFSLDGKYYKAKNAGTKDGWSVDLLSQSATYQKSAYNFLSPDKVYEMPEVLKEISGISFVKESTLYCVQDELGIVFEYHTEKEELTGMRRFTDVGDFEDISISNDLVYTLRSDGTLFYFKHQDYSGKVEQKVIPINSLNFEGLYYHSPEKLFYIASKEPLINGHSKERNIYRFSLKNSTSPQLALSIKLDEISKMVQEKFPELKTNNLQFNPSAISIHPQTGEMYVLSASDRLVAVYKDQMLIEVYPLPAEIYYKPEGLDFADNGDLYIASEGIKKGYVNGMIFLIRNKNTKK